jgi:hypothetical protein
MSMFAEDQTFARQQSTDRTLESGPTGGQSGPDVSNLQNQGNLAGADACSDDTLNDLFDAISAQYTQILGEQIAAVNELAEDAAEQDPPPAWQSVAIAVGTVALSAATAGIGTAITGAIVSATAAVAQDIVKTAISNGIQAAVEGGVSAAASSSDGDMRKTFFRGQADALRRSQNNAQDAFNLSGRAQIRGAADPCAAARDLFQALNAGEQVAKSEQRQKSLASWCNFQARAQLGTHNEGQANAGVALGSQLGDTSAKGVLGLEIEASSGVRSPISVVDAEIEGLNEGLRNELASRPINQLGIAVTAHGQVDPPAWYDTHGHARGTLRFGQNESGTKWKRNSRGGDDWMMWKGVGGPVMSAPGGPNWTDAEKEAYIWEGIDRILDHEIGGRSLNALGVALGG